jgi:hypothetical protein
MNGLQQKGKAAIWIVVALACGAAVWVALAIPQPVTSSALGAEWQCQRAAILTTCTRMSHTAPIGDRLRKLAIDLGGR